MVYDAQTMTRVAFSMLTANLATHPLIASATRHEFAAKTCYAPETARSFALADGGRVMVKVVAYFNDTTVRDLDGVRIGIKIGAVAFDDLDVTYALLNTGNAWHIEAWRDVTAYFIANDPLTASFSVQVAAAFATSAAATVINVGAELFVTYGFDSTVSATLGRVAQFPIQSHHTTPVADGVSYTEIGTTGGAANAPANQIRQLTGSGGAFEDVTGFTLRQRYLIITAMNTRTTLGTVNIRVRFNGGGVVTTYVWTNNVQTTNKIIIYHDITALSSASAHSLEIGTDTSSCEHIGALDVVTYTQDADSPVNFVSIMVPLLNDSSDNTGFPYRLASAADAERVSVRFKVQEPDPVIDQCGVYLNDHLFSSGWDTLLAAAGQTARTYDRGAVSARDSVATVIHRTDHSSSTWAVARGTNKLTFDIWQSTAGSTFASVGGFAIINYRCGLHAQGGHHHNRTVLAAQLLTYVEGSNVSQTPNEPAIPPTRYCLAAGMLVQATLWHAPAGNHLQVGAQRQPTEDSGKGWYRTSFMVSNGVAELGANELFLPANWWREHDSSPYGGDIEAERKWQLGIFSANNGVQANLWMSYYSTTYTVAGNVTIGGAAASDGKTVYIFEYQGINLPAEIVGSVLTTGGTGAFTAEVMDDTKIYFTSYENDGFLGRSASGTPGVDTFDIDIPIAVVTYPDVIVTSHPQFESDSTTAQFAFTIADGVAEFSHNGAPYAPATSPITLTGLSNGAHTLDIRSTLIGGAHQAFAWIVNAAPIALEPLEVPITPADPAYIDHVALAIDRLPAQFRNPDA